jgi:hypothetical protein
MKIHTILEEGNYNGQDLDEDEDKNEDALVVFESKSRSINSLFIII